jgi:hypothetical protein
MSLIAAIRHPFRRNADRTGLEALHRLLVKLAADLNAQLEVLESENGRIGACAAFAFEALENGEDREQISARLDDLAEAMELRRERLACVLLQRDFVTRTGKELDRLRLQNEPSDRPRKLRPRGCQG